MALHRSGPQAAYETSEAMISAAEAFLIDGKLGASETLCRQVLNEERENADALAVLGRLAYMTGNQEQARRMLLRATQIAPNSASHHFTLGDIHHSFGDIEAAVSSYYSALNLDPNFYGVLVNLSNSLLILQKYTAAEEISRRAIELVPESAEAHSNLGQAFLKQGRLTEAHRALSKSVAIAPQRPDLLNNYGVLQQLIGDVGGAIKSFQTALERDPQATLAQRNLKIAVLNSPSWDTRALFKLHVELAKRYNRHGGPGKSTARSGYATDRKLRIGYISSDFHDHPVGNNLIPLLTHHDRNVLEITLYANVEAPDQKTALFQDKTDYWRDTSAWSDAQLARQISEDGIDIAVYLAGRFNLNRVETAVFRPAPIQVSFHDCATTGLEAMDYWLTDSLLHPPETEEQFTEELYRLPVFYQFERPVHVPKVSAAPCLKNGYITFGSFNKPEKISNETVSLWAEILRKTEHSKLMLKYRNLFADDGVKRMWKERFSQEGIEQDRLLLMAGDHARPEHLTLYSQIDIALDPFPFNGATTTFEALLMGIPVITLKGRRFVDRVGATLLQHCALTEFVAADSGTYVDLAVQLASDPAQIGTWRERIRSHLLESPLIRGKKYAKSLEKAYREMWQRKCERFF